LPFSGTAREGILRERESGLSPGPLCGASYFDVVRAHVLTHRQLGPALLVGGLILLVLVAAITWLVALYGSFRFAGPLYRFTRNLREASRQPPMGIRQDDALQETSFAGADTPGAAR